MVVTLVTSNWQNVDGTVCCIMEHATLWHTDEQRWIVLWRLLNTFNNAINIHPSRRQCIRLRTVWIWWYLKYAQNRRYDLLAYTPRHILYVFTTASHNVTSKLQIPEPIFIKKFFTVWWPRASSVINLICHTFNIFRELNFIYNALNVS